MPKAVAAIIGPGNIGTDLLAKLRRSDVIDVGYVVGVVESDGIRRARVFVGYSGWGPGQLDGELELGSWIVEPALAEDVFTETPERLWNDVLRRKGPEHELLRLMPFDPSSN